MLDLRRLPMQQRAYEIAKTEIGVKELPGPENNEEILKYHLSTSLRATHDSVPWCSSFMNWCIEEAGGVGTKSALARSWLVWGSPVEIQNSIPGDIVILSRGNSPITGHVGFLAQRVKKFSPWIHLLGGNQNDQVNVMRFSRLRILGIRRA